MFNLYFKKMKKLLMLFTFVVLTSVLSSQEFLNKNRIEVLNSGYAFVPVSDSVYFFVQGKLSIKLLIRNNIVENQIITSTDPDDIVFLAKLISTDYTYFDSYKNALVYKHNTLNLYCFVNKNTYTFTYGL